MQKSINQQYSFFSQFHLRPSNIPSAFLKLGMSKVTRSLKTLICFGIMTGIRDPFFRVADPKNGGDWRVAPWRKPQGWNWHWQKWRPNRFGQPWVRWFSAFFVCLFSVSFLVGNLRERWEGSRKMSCLFLRKLLYKELRRSEGFW